MSPLSRAPPPPPTSTTKVLYLDTVSVTGVLAEVGYQRNEKLVFLENPVSLFTSTSLFKIPSENKDPKKFYRTAQISDWSSAESKAYLYLHTRALTHTHTHTHTYTHTTV
jgi:hypothetical protein